MKKRILLIGCGISNASLACMLKSAGHYVEIHEKDDRLGGMVKDKWNRKAQCYVSDFGAHIIHFKKGNEKALKWLRSNTPLTPFRHKALCIGNGTFSWFPFDLASRELYGLHDPEGFKKEFIDSYSKKIWGDNNYENIKEVSSRYKFKKERDNDFFSGQKSFQPDYGYSSMIKDLVKGCKIINYLNHDIDSIPFSKFDHVIYSGEIDSLFQCFYGALEFRGIKFIFGMYETSGNPLLPAPQVNLNAHDEYIRITESNMLQARPNNSRYRMLCAEKRSESNRLYPVNSERNKEIFEKYQNLCKSYPKLMLHGRCANYKYKDMDDCIMDSFKIFDVIK